MSAAGSVSFDPVRPEELDPSVLSERVGMFRALTIKALTRGRYYGVNNATPQNNDQPQVPQAAQHSTP